MRFCASRLHACKGRLAEECSLIFISSKIQIPALGLDPCKHAGKAMLSAWLRAGTRLHIMLGGTDVLNYFQKGTSICID
jgi:hypothetical protein